LIDDVFEEEILDPKSGGFSYTGTKSHKEMFEDRRNGLPQFTFSQAKKYSCSRNVVANLNDPVSHHYTAGKEYLQLGKQVNDITNMVYFKTTNDLSSFDSNGKFIETRKGVTIAVHYHLCSVGAARKYERSRNSKGVD